LNTNSESVRARGNVRLINGFGCRNLWAQFGSWLIVVYIQKHVFEMVVEVGYLLNYCWKSFDITSSFGVCFILIRLKGIWKIICYRIWPLLDPFSLQIIHFASFYANSECDMLGLRTLWFYWFYFNQCV